jgi:hypothetical protein
MRPWLALLTLLLPWLLALPATGLAAEITEVCDAADGDDPFDIDLDITFLSLYNRAKITHEHWFTWLQPGQSKRPDYNLFDYKRVVYAMEYKAEIGLYHDVALYVTLPWIIQDKREVKSQATAMKSYIAEIMPAGFVDSASSTRAGIGDMDLGVKWAVFNDQRDDTKSVWVVGFEYKIPSGKLYRPEEVANGAEGSVGLGHHVLTPYMLFSHRFKVLDPYVGISGSIPVQGTSARNAGLKLPIHGGFLAGTEIVPWESKSGQQKFAIDLGLWTTFYSEVDHKGDPKQLGTANELTDFLATTATRPGGKARGLQYTGQYTQFGLKLAFLFKAHDYVRFQMGVSLAHNTEHFVSGADFCQDTDGDSQCGGAEDVPNAYYNPAYDDPGRRLRVEESTLFQWWLTAMATF